MIMNFNTQNNQMKKKKKMKKHDKHKFKALLLERHSYNKWFDIQDDE